MGDDEKKMTEHPEASIEHQVTDIESGTGLGPLTEVLGLLQSLRHDMDAVLKELIGSRDAIENVVSTTAKGIRYEMQKQRAALDAVHSKTHATHQQVQELSTQVKSLGQDPGDKVRRNMLQDLKKGWKFRN